MTVSLLQGKRIVLGVTGSIACYKTADLASKLTQAGALVDVVMTESARRFVTPLTFRSLTGRHVYHDMWDREEHVQHVQLGEEADLLLIAPCTAQTIAKLALGIADNLLTVTALANRGKLMIAPAMDGGMFSHPAVQTNLAKLKKRDAVIAGPAEGRMASGLVGKGRLLETAELIGHVRVLLGSDGPLRGRSILISAGPTQEPFDPVRYITNRSSGKQGMALAQAAVDFGADVTLIAGPIELEAPVGVTRIDVRTAQEMHNRTLRCLRSHDVLIMAAAVADFRPRELSEQKIKKDKFTAAEPTISLARNLDILKAVRNWRRATGHDLVVVGFAAETENILEHGQGKLERKGLDMIAINDVSGSQTGFSVDTNQITLLGREGIVAEIPLQSKARVAEEILTAIAAELNGRAPSS